MSHPLMFMALGMVSSSALVALPPAGLCVAEIEPLVAQLMVDLPSYSNRVSHSANEMGDPTPLYIHVAGQASVTPVSLERISDSPYGSHLPARAARRSRHGREEIYQIAFTTLERQYFQPKPYSQIQPSSPAQPSSQTQTNQSNLGPSLQASNQQQNHWLVLGRKATTSASPWHVISLRSQLTPYPGEEQLLAPPRDARSGVIGRGIVIWLRDQQHQTGSAACAQ